MDKKKIMLYLMHIDWNWIKQRPQYIEEALEKDFDITVLCPRNYRLKEYHDKANVNVFYTIPFIRRYPGIWKIDDWRKRGKIGGLIRKIKPDVIFCTSPEFASSIPASYKGQVIYDCMDDMLAFNTQGHFVERVASQEGRMVKHADLILATSERLKGILEKRYPDAKQKMHIVRNGYDGNIASVMPHRRNNRYAFCYFGTISHWFNFDYILKSLEEFPEIEYRLIGPVEGGTSIPQHERICHIPPVKHEDLFLATQNVDAFIMPFQINELILSVDPVKLYEYINYGKDILCVEYPEIERFSPFVYFYDDYESFANQIEVMKKKSTRKYSEDKRISFLEHNGWQQRAELIVNCIKDLSNDGDFLTGRTEVI